MKKALILTACITASSIVAATPYTKSPSEVVAGAKKSDWQELDPQNILKIKLQTGPVYISLNSELAPNHVANIKALAREGFYTNLNMYRFVENFVAQGGDMSDKKIPQKGKKTIAAEFYHSTDTGLPITSVQAVDGYAPRTGFRNGFAVAQNQSGTKTWMTHCVGAFAMARSNDVNSGGTEFYITLTPQRYLDKNTTVFGQLLSGMEHVQQLKRQPVAGQAYNVIEGVSVLADVKNAPTFKRLRTDTEVFAELISARKNRAGEWFVDTPNHTDVCSVPVPVEMQEAAN
ncbi:peptidylprolyl isomerase [Pseudoalteromonas sp. McH1-7]|uniref:peptidylprolyl isomerase n=1 Tax=unclassified Pseudoalteromonas TaxID=194690 RepID=UPI000F65216E|nr:MULTISPECIES: peptidylprolyl isomerase [unclassified Pseudoalteromonas]NUZ11343.1 peptidylprolyl isomerase [Pseudoalteromonas sp. McH1-7]RRS08640.1 peptidylprolyl isomerase [Pseudoalteromonas sp. J010]